ISEILTWVDEPHHFLTLSLVSRRIKTIVSTPQVRLVFAQRWFDTHCGTPQFREMAPAHIEYVVRYIRLHCLAPHECLPRTIRKRYHGTDAQPNVIESRDYPYRMYEMLNRELETIPLVEKQVDSPHTTFPFVQEDPDEAATPDPYVTFFHRRLR